MRERQTSDKVHYLQRVVETAIGLGADVSAYVAKLREQNPGMSDDELAWVIVCRKSFQNGLVGFFTSLPGLPALPVTIPADLLASWRIQVTTVLAVAAVYGHTAQTTDLRTDVYLVLAGDAAKEVLKQFGIKASGILTQRAVSKYITRDMMNRVFQTIGRKIITKAGEKSLTSFTRMVPVVGGAVGYACDWAATRAVGIQAIRYYGGSEPDKAGRGSRSSKRPPVPQDGPPGTRVHKTVYLVSCVSRKRSKRQPAADLYDSAWFREARAYVESKASPWFILSAEHGLLEPNEVVAPYETTLNRMTAVERRRWACEVLEELVEHVGPGDRAVFLAGRKYREFIAPNLQVLGVTVEVPMEGLRIGKQLAWLQKRVSGRRAARTEHPNRRGGA